MTSEAVEIALPTRSLKLSESSTSGRSVSITSLIERAKAGDSAAFDQIILLYQNKVFATAWRMLGNREDARDAGQEVFLKVFKYLTKFKQEKDFSSWLYQITINVCHDFSRKRGYRDQLTSFEAEREFGNLEEIASPEDVEAAAIKSQEQRIIVRALSQLSQKERAAIVLRDMEGLPTEEVARILGSSQTTVRSQISSARAKIKAHCDLLLNPQAKGGEEKV